LKVEKKHKIPTRQKTAWLLTFLFITSVCLAILATMGISKTSSDFVRNESLVPGEIFELTDNDRKLADKSLSIVLTFPQNQPNSKLMTIKNESTALSVFSIDGNAFIFFQSPSKNKKIKVFQPISVPLTTSDDLSSVSIEVDEKSQTIEIVSDVVSHRWTPPQENQDLNFSEIQSGNTRGLDVVVNWKDEFDVWLAITIASIPISFLIIALNRARIRRLSLQMLRSVRTTSILSKKLIFGTLIAGFGLVSLLPSSPPAGNLIHTSVDATKVSSSDLFVMNEKLAGGWLFTNPPDLGLPTEDYTSTFAFDLNVNLDTEERFTEIFALGLPQGVLASPLSVENLELSMNAKQRLSFKVPSKNGRSTWVSKGLKPGIYRIHGEIRNGREVELSVDDTLIYAMAADTPNYFLQQPNLFMSEYLIDNLESGNFSWNIKSEVAKPVWYGIYRLQMVLASLLLVAGFSFMTLQILSRSVRPNLSNKGSHEVINASYKTFFILSGLGVLLWSLSLQPAIKSGWPRNYPFFLSQYRFSDLTQIFLSSQFADPYTVANVTYPPFGTLLFNVFGFLSAKQATILFISASLAVVFSVFVRIVQLRIDFNMKEKIATVAMLLLSFPLLFAIDRGNLDLVLTALLLLAVWDNLKEGPSYRAGILIGLASAIKIYPLLLLPIFYYNKRDIRLLIASTTSFVALSFLGAWKFNLGPVTFLKTIVLGSAGQGLVGDDAIRWNGSLAGLVTTATKLVAPKNEAQVWDLVSSQIVTLALLLLSVLVLAFMTKHKFEKAKFTLASVSMLTLIFPSTPAYRFTIFLVAIAFVLLIGINESTSLPSIGILLGVILSPVVYWYFGMGSASTYSIIIPLATLSLLLYLLKPSQASIMGSNESSFVEPIQK
jgi:hypothetical protein